MDILSSHSSLKLKALVAIILVAILSLGVYVYQGKKVLLMVDDESFELSSNARTVEEFLSKEAIVLEKGGYINVPLEAELEEGMTIVIRTPKTYSLSLGGMLSEGIVSSHNRVKDILDELNISLGDLDEVTPGLDEKLSNGDLITITKISKLKKEKEEVIPFGKLVNNNNRLDKGVENLVQQGEDGLKRIELEETYIDGRLVSSEVTGEEVLKDPVSQIVERGTRTKIATPSRGNTEFKSSVVMTATAYDLSYASTGKRPGDRYYGMTASGTRARPGVVAVDPRVIPLGTKLYIESLDGWPDYGFATAEDTGGAIKGNKIDLFFESAQQVKKFGRRKVKVYILK